MVFETTPTPLRADEKKDPVLMRAEAILARVGEIDPHDKEDSLREKIAEAEKSKVELTEQYKREGDAGKQAKLNVKITALNETIHALKARHDALLKTAQERLQQRAEPGDALEKNQADLKAAIAALDAKIALLTPGDPKLTPLLKQKAELVSREANLSAREERSQRMAKAREYHAEVERLHEEELAEIEAKTNAALATIGAQKTPEAPATAAVAPSPRPQPAPQPVQAPREVAEVSEQLSQADQLALGMAMELAARPPQTTGDKIFHSLKIFVLRFWCYNGSPDYQWAKQMSASQLNLLSRNTGLTLTPKSDGNPGFKAEWKPLDASLQQPAPLTQKVFAKFMHSEDGGPDWIPTFDKVAALKEGKPTLKDVLDSIPTSSQSKEDAYLLELTNALIRAGGNATSLLFFDVLSAKGHILLGNNDPQPPTTTPSPAK